LLLSRSDLVKEPMMRLTSPTPPPQVSASLRILVADDNAVLRTAVRGILRLQGHAAESVANGRQAVEEAARRAYDLVLLDIHMPVMDGLEAAAELREGRAHGAPWIVGVSADDDGPDVYASAGFDDFLRKPLGARDLARMVERCTAGARQPPESEGRSGLHPRAGRGQVDRLDAQLPGG
jgi:CheY-like chemotaxis protein